MQSTIDKSTIQEMLTTVLVLRKNEDVIDQERLIDSFLDSILAYRRMIMDRADVLTSITKDLSLITHIDHASLLEEDYEILASIIDECKLLYSASMRLYSKLNKQQPSYVKEERKQYKNAIDDFLETYQDVHSAFFVFPEDDAFQKINNELEELLG